MSIDSFLAILSMALSVPKWRLSAMEQYVPIMILVPLILILAIIVIADFHIIVRGIQHRGFRWIKNSFLMFLI